MLLMLLMLNSAEYISSLKKLRIFHRCSFYGIYAYGEEADYLASLMYYSHNNARPDASIEGHTFVQEGYYNASDTAGLQAAINDIFIISGK